MNILYSRFIPYCKRNDIDLMRDDIKFLEKQLMKIAPDLHRHVLKRYSEEWLRDYQKQEKSSQKQNLGRKSANLWLIGYVARIESKK